jgi:Fic family protein
MNKLPIENRLRLDSALLSTVNEVDKSIAALSGIHNALEFEKDVFALLTTREAVASLNIDFDSENIYKFSDCFDNQKPLKMMITRYNSSIDLGYVLLKNFSKASHIITLIYAELSGEEARINGEIKYRTDTNLYYPLPTKEEIQPLLENLDEYIALDTSYPQAINTAIIHAQFEKIHPYKSHNGLTGRIIFHLYLKWKNRLQTPIIQLSQHLLQRKSEYFDRLVDIDKSSGWEDWIKFFLDVVRKSSVTTNEILKNIFQLRKNDLEKLTEKELISTASLKLFNYLYKQPVFTIPEITKELGYSKQTANILVSKFMDQKIITETTGQQRYRVYTYKNLIDILEKDDYE